MGENPSPLGEDFSLIILNIIHILMICRTIEPQAILNMTSKLT